MTMKVISEFPLGAMIDIPGNSFAQTNKGATVIGRHVSGDTLVGWQKLSPTDHSNGDINNRTIYNNYDDTEFLFPFEKLKITYPHSKWVAGEVRVASHFDHQNDGPLLQKAAPKKPINVKLSSDDLGGFPEFASMGLPIAFEDQEKLIDKIFSKVKEEIEKEKKIKDKIKENKKLVEAEEAYKQLAKAGEEAYKKIIDKKSSTKNKDISKDKEPINSDMEEKLLELMDDLDKIIQSSPPEEQLSEKEAAAMEKMMDKLPAEPPKSLNEWKAAVKALEEMTAIFQKHSPKTTDKPKSNTTVGQFQLGDMVDVSELNVSNATIIGRATNGDVLLGFLNAPIGITASGNSGSYGDTPSRARAYTDSKLLVENIKSLERAFPTAIWITGNVKASASLPADTKKQAFDDKSVVAMDCAIGTVIDSSAFTIKQGTVIGKNKGRNEVIIGLQKASSLQAYPTAQAGHFIGDEIMSGKKVQELSATFPYYVTIKGDIRLTLAEDAPTEIDANGTQYWKVNGVCHRENGPAMIDKAGNKYWYKNGGYHRINGPAVEYANGSQAWHQNGMLHREDGPAQITAQGGEMWAVKGAYHRVDGPAIIADDGSKQWMYQGKRHRLDGPAIETADGVKEWWQNNKRHRVGGPAIETPDRKEWYQNNCLHREDGPAIEWSDGYQEWWRDGKQATGPLPKVIHLEKEPEAVAHMMQDISDSFKDLELPKENFALLTKKGKWKRNSNGDLMFETQPTFGQTLKNDVKQAGYRVAANQISKGVKSAIVSLLQKGDSSSTHLQTISEMLDTQYGEGLISFLLGLGLQQTTLSKDERVEKIAEEFRIEGMSGVGNQAFSTLMDALTPAISKALNDLPKEESKEVRIAISTPTPVQVEPEVQLEEELTHAMTMDTSG